MLRMSVEMLRMSVEMLRMSTPHDQRGGALATVPRVSFLFPLPARGRAPLQRRGGEQERAE
jgi:hypothetical protein